MLTPKFNYKSAINLKSSEANQLTVDMCCTRQPGEQIRFGVSAFFPGLE